MRIPFLTKKEDVQKNLQKLVKITGLRQMASGKWRGECPACGYNTFEVSRSEENKIVWTCHQQLYDMAREDHRKEILDELHSHGIYLKEYSPLPVTEMVLAEFPFFVFDRKKNLSIRNIDYRETKIELIPDVLGHPTAWDEPLYLLAVRQAKEEFERTGKVPEEVSFHLLDYLRWIGGQDKEITGERSRAIEGGLKRMAGLQVATSFEFEKGKLMKGKGLISSGEYGRHKGIVNIRLAEWTRTHIEKNMIIHLPEGFFSLTPLRRKIYQVLHKHLGGQKEFYIKLENLKIKTGFERESRKFKFEVKANSDILDIAVRILSGGKILATRSSPDKKVKKTVLCQTRQVKKT